MALYQGQIDTYTLNVQSPNQPTNYKSVIYVKGSFGLGFLYLVPEGGSLGTNKKRTGQNVFDIYFWMYSWPHIVDTLRNEKPVYFFYNDSNNTCVIKTSDEPIGEEESP